VEREKKEGNIYKSPVEDLATEIGISYCYDETMEQQNKSDPPLKDYNKVTYCEQSTSQKKQVCHEEQNFVFYLHFDFYFV